MKRVFVAAAVGICLTTVSLVVLAGRPAESTRRPISPRVPTGSPPDSSESGARECPPTPLSKSQILGEPEEGCERVKIQDLELDFSLMLKEARRIRADRQEKLASWTPQRRRRAQAVGADRVVTRLDRIVRNRKAAIALGKMFFWEQRAGSDGQTACASCHYHAGADVRAASLGVAQSRIAVAKSPRADGLEPSARLQPYHILQSYEYQWGGMTDFPRVLMKQAVRAVTRADREIAGLQLSAEQRRTINAWVTYLQQFPAVRQALARLRRTLASGPAQVPEQGNFEVANTVLTLAAELATYAQLRRSSRRATTKTLLDEVDKRLAAVASKADLKLPDASGPRRLQVIQRLLAPYEAAQAQQPYAAKRKDVSEPDPFQTRAETPRNTPTVINATLFDRLFHDGRAASVFNGYDHLGDEAGRDGFGKWICDNGCYRRALIRLPHAAAASQATAPLLSAGEMSWFGRQYHHVARKLLDAKPLARQDVHPDDSVLAKYLGKTGAANGKRTIRFSYRDMIRMAFRSEWHCGTNRLLVRERDAMTGQPLALTQIEANFSLFWGIAIQLYEETLISDQTQFDRLMTLRRQGKPLPKDQATRDILLGFEVFQDHACADCHAMPELAGGTFATVFGPILEFEGPLDAVNAATEKNEFVDWLRLRKAGLVPDQRIEAMPFRPGLAPRIYDAGYYNIGVSPDVPQRPGQEADPAADSCDSKRFDPGNGGQVRVDLGSPGKALFSVRELFGSGLPVALLEREPFLSYSLARRRDERRAVAIGAFKTSSLRNITLTAPYFHNGCAQDLEAVLDHYSAPEFAHNRFIHPAMLGEGREAPEVSIPKNARAFVHKFFAALTDPRVPAETGPFDHPSLRIPRSPSVSNAGQSPEGTLKTVPATGTPR